MKNTQTKLQILREAYFDALEENCVDFTEYDDAGTSIVIDEYSDVSVFDMCDYLGMPNWLIEWTQDLINEEEKEIKEAEEMAKQYQEEEPQLFSECCGALMDCDSSFCSACGEHAVGEPKEIDTRPYLIDTCTEAGIIDGRKLSDKKESTIL